MKLSSLTERAEAFLREEKADKLSFRKLIPAGPYFDLVSARLNQTLDIADITPRFVGYDMTAPEGDRTMCDLCIADEVINKAHHDHPQDEKLQWLVQAWKDLDSAMRGREQPRKTPREVVQMKNDLDRTLAGWTETELQRIQDLFLAARNALGIVSGAQFAPRYVSRIYMREEDEHRGEVQEKSGQPIRVGSFVAVKVWERTCFARAVFALGLRPGYHVLAGCGNADDHGSDLYALRNIRLKLKDDVHRRTDRAMQRWQLLYAQTYDQALKIKELNTEQLPQKDPREPETASSLWVRGSVTERHIERKDLWIQGEELEKLLGDPDRTYRHTVRAVTLRKSLSRDDWEILLVLERGDQKSGGAATKKTGKPPAFGCPGGMVEKNETVGRALTRETENEAQTREVTKVVACVAEYKKAKRPDSDMENIDHWFVVEVDREAGTSKKLVETLEIKDVRWVPLADLAQFRFQNTRPGKASWNLSVILEQKLMYPNHAANLIRILPRIPGIVLPENWKEFEENLRKFGEGNRS
ncbi:NUDIX domain-containing protein [Patescibacteria group bacterium]|nr:NUDIX domain-containing protein [Patescibacteria group bacterium]